MKRLLILLISSTCISGCYLGTELPPDQETWGYKLPSESGLDDAQLRLVDGWIKDRQFENINGLMIVKDQNIVFENYYLGLARNNILPQGRNTSLFGSIAVGLLLKDNYLDSVGTPLHVLLPEYSDIFNSAPEKRAITIKELLTHTTGLIWEEMNLAYDSPQNYVNLMQSSDDWVRFVLEQPVEAPPGLRLVFNSGSSMIISKLVENLTGRSAEEYLQNKLFDPLRIKNPNWENGKGAATNLTDGLSLTLLDLNKIAYLFLSNGFWEGNEIISPRWVRSSTETFKTFSAFVNYGYGWMVFSDELRFIEELETNDVFFYSNEVGTSIYIVPHLSMTVAISATNPFYSLSNPSLSLFLNILAAR